ncbi:class I tRNA ligase family protein, partial [Salmonella enterica]|uniref:class I tRNA ligase family protein n=1 Tax=Salmonella enterica TaxID=28901 RepID=UPI003CE94353
TLNLPDPASTIPMKADLPQLEPAIQAQWEEAQIYHEIQKARKDAPLFVLHDGPPYTNSPIHIGTAMNKILKDFVVKSRT